MVFTSWQHYRLVGFFGINVKRIARHLMELPLFALNIIIRIKYEIYGD